MALGRSAPIDRLELGGNFVEDIGFDDVSRFEIIEILNRDTAFIALLHFPHIILEPSKRSKLAFVHHHVVPKNAYSDTGPGHGSFHHVTTRHQTGLRDGKHLSDLGSTERALFEHRLKERDLPKFERSTYARAVDKGGEAGGERALAALTAHVCQQAGKLLDRLASDAADALGLPGAPSDPDMLEMLEEAAEAYSFEPAESSSRGVRYAAAGIGLAGGGGGNSIAAS